MHNTYLLTLVMMLTAVSASAQFYTITKENEISVTQAKNRTEYTEIKEDTIETLDSIVSCAQKSGIEENLPYNELNARKSDDNKSSRIRQSRGGVNIKNVDLMSHYSTAPNINDTLPELTIPNLIAEIKKNNIKYPKIVLAQAILETGWFKSSVCRNMHNLFGLTNPRTGKYYEFNHWTESVKAYYTKVQHRYTGGNYLLWLDKIGYAEEKTYVRALIKLLKQL